MKYTLVALGLICAAPMAAQEVNVQLQLISLHCIETEDSGDDEAYLLLNGNKTRVWSISDDETVDLRGMEPTPFDTRLLVELMDEDGPLDGDDSLGSFVIGASELNEGEMMHEFTGDDAHYRLTYIVQPRER